MRARALSHVEVQDLDETAADVGVVFYPKSITASLELVLAVRVSICVSVLPL